MTEPFYKDESVIIYHADCRDVLPDIGTFDLLLTDPPYGIDADNQARILSRGKLANPKDYGVSDWDGQTVEPSLVSSVRGLCGKQIIFGGNYYNLPPTACWLVWDKQNGSNDFADCELAWTNLKKAARLKAHLWNGMIRKNNETREHPTQKPLEVIEWALSLAGDDVETVLDPFAGSGTPGRAAKDLNKKAVLIEREERYCEVAAKRMSQEVFQWQ